MLNKVIIQGRLTADVELRHTQSDKTVASFCVAVDRNFVPQGQERQADFINCVVWGKTAEFTSKYIGAKGSPIIVEGSLQTRPYEDKNGNKRTATEVVASNVYFDGKKNDTGSSTSNDTDDTVEVSDDSLPFN